MSTHAPNGYFADGLMLFGALEKGGSAAKGFVLQPPDLRGASVATLNSYQDKIRTLLANLGEGMRAQFQWTCNSDYAARANHGPQLFGMIAKAIVIVAAIAYMNVWFPQVEKVFLNVAEYIDPGYNADPTSASQAIREGTTDNPEGQEWSWRHINESIYMAVSRALANVFIYIGTLVAVPMHILQYVLRWLVYLTARAILISVVSIPRASSSIGIDTSHWPKPSCGASSTIWSEQV